MQQEDTPTAIVIDVRQERARGALRQTHIENVEREGAQYNLAAESILALLYES